MRRTFLDQTPIRMGTAEEFACVARTLKDASFDEETICRTFKLEDMADVGSITPDDVERADVSPQLRQSARFEVEESYRRSVGRIGGECGRHRKLPMASA